MRYVVLALSATLATAAAAAYALLYAWPFLQSLSEMPKQDREWIEMSKHIDLCAIFYGTLFLSAKAVGRFLLDAQTREEIAVSGARMSGKMNLMAGLVLIVGNAFLLSRYGWNQIDFWLHIALGVVLLTWAIISALRMCRAKQIPLYMFFSPFHG